jgi:hydrogenase expression/formation protein HypD
MYRELCSEYGIACTVTGFEAEEILIGILSLVNTIQNGGDPVKHAYPRAVKEEGNLIARNLTARIFEPVDALWRGLGSIPDSGLGIREEYADFDAYRRFPLELEPGVEPKGCRCGEVLRGICTPAECPLFGNRCVPEDPVGACMVSSEGSCAAWYNYS